MVKRGGVWTVVWGLVVLVAWAGMVVAAPVEKEGKQLTYHPGRVLVKFRKEASTSAIQATVAASGLTEIRSFPRLGVHVMRIAPGRTVEETLATLKTGTTAERPVLYAEPDYVGSIAQVIPNDPMFPSQWDFDNTGQMGTPDADIDAPEAWAVTTNASSIVVGVIDTGVDYTHPDLACNIWTNPGETPANGIDDDGNGYVDDVHGYDFCSYDDGMWDPDPMDDYGHGTHCSGTIGACTNNATGVAGVCWSVKIMGLKWIAASGWGYTSDAVAAVDYATMMGVQLTSNSWHIMENSLALRDAIAAANDAGILFVVAAANSGVDLELMPDYPVCYDLPNIISVAATDFNDVLAPWSNYGLVSVDLAAPGCGIWSTVPGASYDCWAGTSMATPHVAGAAALVWGMNPSLTAECVKAQLLGTVDPLTALDGKVLTGGRLNLYSAVTCDPTALRVYPAPGAGFRPGTWTIDQGIAGIITAYVTECCAAEGASAVASFDNSDPDLPLLDDGVAPDLYGGDAVFSGTWVPGAPGNVNVTITATEAGHNPGIASFAAHVITNVCYMYDVVAFEWEDISGTGTVLPELYCDDCYTVIPEPFDFQFYGVSYDTVAVSSNGTLYFQDAYLGLNNGPIPADTGYGVNTFVAPFWDDLYLPTVYYEIRGVAPERRLIVQYQNTQHFAGTPGAVTFQTILYETTGEIRFQYLDATFGDAGYDYGISATVGIQGDSSTGLQYSFNQPALYDGLAIRFWPDYECAEQVLLVQDAYPWENNTNEAALTEAGIGYTTIQSAALPFTDLSDFCAVMYSSDQSSSYYWNLDASSAQIEEFVANGGVLVAHSCDGGWNGGDWTGLHILPGNVQKTGVYQENIHILEPGHPVVAGLNDDYFYGWSGSTHGYFTGLAPDTTVVMESNPGEPTYLEYPWGAGRVLATMQTSEWGYSVRGKPEFLRNELAYLRQIMCGGGPSCVKTVSTPAEAMGWPGGDVVVPVMVDNPSGIMGFDITLEYCGDWLSVVNVTPGDCLDESWSLYPDYSVPGQVRVIGFSLAGPLIGAEQCGLFNVEFAIGEGTPLGTRCQLAVPSADLSDDTGNPIGPVCSQPGEVVVPLLDHLHFSVDPSYDVLGAGVACPMAVSVTCEAHDPSHNLVDLDGVGANLSSNCGMTVSPDSITLWDGAWTAPVSIFSPADEVCESCSLQGAIEGVGQWNSDPLTLRGKGDLDANCEVQIFDVIRAVNLMLGTPVTPPNGEYQVWAADNDCSSGHPCGNDAIEIFDLVRTIRYMLDGVWPCAGGAGGRAALAGAGPMKLSLSPQRLGDEVMVAVRVGQAQGLAGLDLTVNWQAGNLRFLGASAGSLANSNWLVQAQESNRSVRIVSLDAGGSGVSGTGDLVVLRFQVARKGKQAARTFSIGAVSASDAFGQAIAIAK